MSVGSGHVCAAVVHMVLGRAGNGVASQVRTVTGGEMAQVGAVVEAGQARDGYRLRVSSTARTALGAEWDRCRWDASFVVPAQVEPLPQTGPRARAGHPPRTPRVHHDGLRALRCESPASPAAG